VSEQRKRPFRMSDGRIAVLLLWAAFAVGCAIGAAVAAEITEAALLRLRESLFAYRSAALGGTLRQSFGACLLDLLPWTLASLLAALFVSSTVTLPLLLGLRGGVLGYLTAALLRLCGWPDGLWWLGAVCGAKNALLLLSMSAAIVPNFIRALRRVRLRGSHLVYALDRTYLRSAAVSLVAMLAGAAADLYLTPVLTAWLAR